MDYHQNARLVVYSREQMAKIVVQQGSTLKATATACIGNSLKSGANEAAA